MTLMYVFHDALRRELQRLARVTARSDDDPKRILRTALGWELFKSYLHVHHSAEDEMLWPPMREALGDSSNGTALLDAMEAEHAAIDPLLAAIDSALADRDSGPEQLGGLTDALDTALRAHLDHEETEGLPLIDATLTAQQWQAFGADAAQRIGADAQRALPWMLESARPDAVATMIGQLPPPVQQAYREVWQPAYAELTLWS